MKAKVKTLEERGNGRASKPGVLWGVPYSMMTPVDAQTTLPAKAAPPPQKLVYSPFNGSDNLILEAIFDCYNGLSPENLCCDGEASTAYIFRTRNELNRKLRGLFIAFGREVDEGEIYDWYLQKTDKQKKA